MRILKLTKETQNNILENLLKRSPNSYGEFESRVNDIIQNVREKRDEAIFEYTLKFDGATIDQDNIRVTEEAIKEAVEQSFEKKAIVEEYIEGDEYSYETISYHGTHTNLAVTKKYTTGAPHFIETGHVQPSGLSEEMLKKVRSVMYPALDALKITDGASHGEFRITPEGDVRIIEIGSRMGGDCIGSDLVPLSTGYDFMEMIVDVACGKEPKIVPKTGPKEARIRFLFTMDDVEEMKQYEKEHPEEIYRISELDLSHLGHVSDSSTRLGYYITVKELS